MSTPYATEAISPFTLRFKEKQLESKFYDDYYSKSVVFVRIAIILGIFLLTVFGILDDYTCPNSFYYLCLIRYAFLLPVLTVALYLSFCNTVFKAVMQPFLATVAIICGTGMVAMIHLAGKYDSKAGSYCSILIVLIIILNVAIRLRFIYTFFTSFIIILSFFLVSVFFDDMLLGQRKLKLINDLSVLLEDTSVCLFASYQLEKLFRIGFIQRLKFEDEKQKVSEALDEKQIAENELQKLNNNLENLVDQRNKELEKEKQKTIKSLIEGQETERNRMAKDLHDGLCVELANAKHKIELAIKETNLDILAEAIIKIDEISDTTRNISHSMAPYVLKRFGLEHALKDFFEQIEKQTNIKLNVYLYGLEKRLDETSEINIYRIVQELTANIIKHSQATEAEIQVMQNDEKINMVISDNGIGFADNVNMTNNGIGLQNVRSRVKVLNGSINIDSQKRHGTTIVIELQL